MNIVTNIKPDLKTAVDLIDLKIRNGIRNDMIETQFGNIVWTLKDARSTEDSSAVYPFEDAPGTEVYLKYRHKGANFYVEIYRKRNQHPELTRIFVVQAMAYCLLSYLTGMKDVEQYADAVTFMMLVRIIEKREHIHGYEWGALNSMADRIAKYLVERDTTFLTKVKYSDRALILKHMKNDVKRDLKEAANEFDNLSDNARKIEKISPFQDCFWRGILTAAMLQYTRCTSGVSFDKAKHQLETFMKKHEKTDRSFMAIEFCKEYMDHLKDGGTTNG